MTVLRTIIFVAALSCGLSVAHGQIELTCRVEPTRAVLHEPIVASLRIQNTTSQPITIGDAQSRLWFEVELVPGRRIRQSAERLLEAPLTIPPRQHVTHRIDLTRAYDIRATGAYTVWAGADWNGRAYSSGRVYVDVVPGLELMRTIGPAGPGGSGIRLYRLMTLNRDRGEHLFLRIDDEDAGVCYGVLHLGRVVRVQAPRFQVDANGNITVLHQAGPGRFFYHVYTPDGARVARRVYTSEEPGVTLVEGEGGRYVVSGASASIHDTE